MGTQCEVNARIFLKGGEGGGGRGDVHVEGSQAIFNYILDKKYLQVLKKGHMLLTNLVGMKTCD